MTDPALTYHVYFHPKLLLWMARWGLEDKAIAAELGIPITMLDDWKAQHPEVAEAIKTGRAYWFDLSEQSLQKLIKGYDYNETVIELDAAGGDTAKPTKVRKTTRHIPPNVAAITFMMRNSPIFELAKQIDREMLATLPSLPKKP